MRTPDSTTRLLRRVLSTRTDVLDQLEAAHAAAWEAVDPALLDLCRMRIAMLLGCDDELAPRHSTISDDTAASLASWPTSPRFDDTQRACLAYTEQHVVDVAAMDDATVARVSDALGPDGLVDFANALLVVEQRIRLRLIWESLLGEAA